MSVWDPMKEQYFSKRNAYSVDVNDPAVAILGYGDWEDKGSPPDDLQTIRKMIFFVSFNLNFF